MTFLRAHLDSHDGVLQHGRAARGGADTRKYRPQSAAVRNDARFPRQRTRTFRARRILFTSCQTARVFSTPSTPCGWTRHEGTGVLLATRDRPDVGRWHRATSLYLRKAKLFAVNMFPAGACFPCLRFLLPKLRVLTKLFSLFEANLKITVSLRRSKTKTMPNDG